MRILGIDPGYDIVGFAVLDWNRGQSYELVDGGIIKTDPDLDYWLRLQRIQQDLQTIIEENKPMACAMETLLFSKNKTTAIKVAQARGVIGAALTDFGIEIQEYGPSQIKLALTGHGKAEKWQMQEMVKRMLDLPEIPKPDDFADALAVALTWRPEVDADSLSTG